MTFTVINISLIKYNWVFATFGLINVNICWKFNFFFHRNCFSTHFIGASLSKSRYLMFIRIILCLYIDKLNVFLSLHSTFWFLNFARLLVVLLLLFLFIIRILGEARFGSDFSSSGKVLC